MQCRFQCRPESVAAARRFVVATLRDVGQDGAMLDDAQLIVSELATNAVRHARTDFTVEIRTNRVVRIAVSDGVPGDLAIAPVVPNAIPRASGHGLRLVAAISDRWGVEPDGTGKRVWSEVEVL